MKIDEAVLKRLVEKDLVMDDLLILFIYYRYLKFDSILPLVNSERFPILIERKLISSKPLDITQLGVETFQYILGIASREIYEQAFETWWTTFPLSNKTDIFPMTRIIRSGNKNKIKGLYMSKIQGEITPEYLLKALTNEIKLRKNISTKDNALTFMQSPQTWLNNETYLTFIDIDTENTSKYSEYGKGIL